MALERQQRENLLDEATALIQRVALAMPGQEQPAVVGFRRDGSVSIYLTDERVYHFTSRGRLRRAFLHDVLFKAERGQLVALNREHHGDEVHLVRHDLDFAESAALLADMQRELRLLLDRLTHGECQVAGQVPSNVDVCGRVRGWLQGHNGAFVVAAGPHAR